MKETITGVNINDQKIEGLDNLLKTQLSLCNTQIQRIDNLIIGLTDSQQETKQETHRNLLTLQEEMKTTWKKIGEKTESDIIYMGSIPLICVYKTQFS